MRYIFIRDYAHYKRTIKKLRDRGYSWYNQSIFDKYLPGKYSDHSVYDHTFRNEMNFFLIVNDEEKTILWSRYKQQ